MNEVTIIGKGIVTSSKNGKTYHMLDIAYPCKTLESGKRVARAFTNEKTYESLECGKSYDLAVFFENNGVTKVYAKKEKED